MRFSLSLSHRLYLRDGPDQPLSHFDSPSGSSYFHGGGGNYHSNFPPNVLQSAGGSVVIISRGK